MTAITLAEHLATGGASESLAKALLGLAGAAALIARLAARGDLPADPAPEGEAPDALERVADRIVLDALAETSVAYYAAEGQDSIQTLDPKGDLAVAATPLDGSIDVEGDVAIGTLFAVFPVSDAGATESFFRPGEELLAAGYFIYGPHTALALSVGEGVDLFVLDPGSGAFRLTRSHVRIPTETREFAIDMSNYRHWHHPVRVFVDDCIAGQNGPRGQDYAMRWIASLVAEAHRILARGGLFLYPADHRPGCTTGRLRLIHQAFPIAFLAEQAGGAATEGHHRILGLTPTDLGQLTPLVFGSTSKVEMVGDYHLGGPSRLGDAPLFGRRGLYRKSGL